MVVFIFRNLSDIQHLSAQNIFYEFYNIGSAEYENF